MSRLLLLILALAISLTIGNADRVRYDNYKIYKVIPQAANHLELLHQLEQSSDSLKFLSGLTIVGKSVSILVAPHKQPEFIDILRDNGVSFELVERNLQRTLDAEQASFQSRRAGIYDWSSYHTLDETYDWLRTLPALHPGKVELINGGRTYEGRDIIGVKVSFKSGNKGVFLEGGIHPREWISPAAVTYILNQLLTSQDPVVRAMAEKFDWYVFPHTNPDGFVYTHKGDRMWRKTRSKGLLCYGADPNRNWDFFWKTVGASSSTCSDTYAGASPFSEIETKTLSDYISSLDGKIHTYISFHAFSQFLLFPYGYTKDRVPNYNDLKRIGDAAAAGAAKRYGSKFTVGSIHETIYASSGSSIEWIYGKKDIKLAFAYELRPSGSASNGFILPANQIVPASEETLDSVIALLDEAEKLNYFK